MTQRVRSFNPAGPVELPRPVHRRASHLSSDAFGGRSRPLGRASSRSLPLKTTSSRRPLSLPALAVEDLKARRKAQLEERMRAGADWKWSADDLVFATAEGKMLHPGTVRDVLAATLKAAGLDVVKFHTLRHTAATLLLTDGTPLFDVSRILGHAQISTTADIYGHLVPEMAAGAAARMDQLLKAKA